MTTMILEKQARFLPSMPYKRIAELEAKLA